MPATPQSKASKPSSSKKRKSDASDSNRPTKQSKKISSYFPPLYHVSSSPKEGESRPVPLNDEQKRVLEMVVDEGKNVFFTGAAGTGKSLLLRAIISALRKKHVKKPAVISVTASTGMAASNIGGMTIHSWGAVTPGQTDLDKQIRCIRTCKPALNRWKTTKVLVIDEVSMVDGHLFDTLSSIAQSLRKNTERPFGGIQLVVTGDFFQLPPITKGNAEPFFAFESAEWKKSIEHTVTLTHVFRQKDHKFVDLLNSLRMGVASQTAVATFNNLRRPLPAIDGIVPTELFPLRNEVKNANKMRLDALKTESQIYESRDTGSATEERRATILKNMVVQRVLEIKVDAQVMLIKNVDENLVNGSIGKVLGFYMVSEVCGSGGEISSKGGNGFIRRVLLGDDGKTPVERKVAERENENHDVKPRSKSSPPESNETFPLVEFRTPLGKEVVLVGRDEFKVEENDGTVAARRVQIPLVLAWAMSIHKSQGQTLQYVKIDLAKVFEKGQSYVALSRASALEGLQVIHFNPMKVKAHAKVIDWHRTLQLQAEQDAKGAEC